MQSRLIFSHIKKLFLPLKALTHPLSNLYRKRPRLPKPAWLCIEEEPDQIKFFRKEEKRHQKEKFCFRKDEDKPTSITDLEEQLSAYQADWLAVMAPEESCFYQELTLALTDPATIEEVLPFQLEHILPFAAEEARWAFSVHPLSKGSSRLFVSCMRRQLLTQLQERWHQVGLEVDLAISPAFVIHLAHLASPKRSLAVVYAWLRSEGLSFFFVDSTGIRGVRDALLEGKDLSVEQLHQEWRKTQLYLQVPASCERCLIGSLEGKESLMEAFDTPQMHDLSLEDRFYFMPQAMAQVAKAQSQRLFFSLSGSCFKGSVLKKYAFALKHFQKSLSVLALASLFLCYASLSKASYQLQLASEKLVETAKLQGVELNEEMPSGDPLDWIDGVGRQLDKRLSAYPLLPNLPSARDTLAWVNHQISQVPSAKLISFDYLTQTHPDPKHPSVKYRVKVELELEISDLGASDHVQQQFLHATGWIDKPSTLSWKAQKDRYKVSFYLKDRTTYAI